MKNGYDQFFTKVKENKLGDSQSVSPKVGPSIHERRIQHAVRKSRAQAKMQKKQFPASIFFGLGLICVMLGLALFTPKQVEDYLSMIEVQWMGQARAAGAEKSAGAKGENKENSTAGKVAEGATAGAKSAEAVAEDISHFKKLSERKTELDQREAELTELEEELQRRSGEIEARIQHLEGVKREIASILKDRVQLDEERVGKLVEFYSNMKPKQAADILGTVNEDLAVEVLSKMKKKNAAQIMNLLKADKAQVITEKLAGYRR